MSAEKMQAFADSLFERGDYYRAITEYERVIFFHPEHPAAKTARFQIARSYLQGEKLDQAAVLFRAISKEYGDEETGRKSFLMLGEAYYRKGDYLRAADVFTTFTESYPADPRADAARLKSGWAYLREGEWQQARDEFRKMPEGSTLVDQAEALAQEAGNYPELPRKSPGLAGTLSALLPGSGQLYVGRRGDAVASFLLNGAFIWATSEAFRKDNDVTGGILLFFGSGWYLGNVYNAVSSAHKYNRRSEEVFLEDLKSRYDVSLSRSSGGESRFLITMRFP